MTLLEIKQKGNYMKTTETMRNSESKSQEAMATLHITSYPYVTMYGDLDVPEELDTDFTGTEFEFE